MRTFRISLICIYFFWTTGFIIMYLEGRDQHDATFRKLAIQKAEKNFLKDLSFRKWVTSHGGVYVPATSSTPPNPYLKGLVPEQNISTPSGKKLTLMNPAYAIRQIMAFYEKDYGIRGRITSLKPLNPSNAPSPWEKRALLQLEQGKKKILEFRMINGIPTMAFIKPLITDKGCLKCHRKQGYSLGDIRGGIAVYFSLLDLQKIRDRDNSSLLFTSFFFWGIGCVIIALGAVRIHKGLLQKRVHLNNLHDNLEEKETLIKEIHHRVKNNLQVISSLINLQLYKTDKADSSRETLGKTANRIETIANIHEMLYHSHNLKDIDMGSHFQTIFSNLQSTFNIEHKNIRFEQVCNNIRFNINIAIPVGLLVNELMTNSLKHAFRDKQEGRISITLEKIDSREYLLLFTDNGCGMSDTVQPEEPRTLGMSLISSLVKQLEGSMDVMQADGTQFTIRFTGADQGGRNNV